MNLFLLSILSLLLSPLTETPNFYSSYTSARDASRNTQKEMLVFFTNSLCTTCESAWHAFEKDGMATSNFVSTKMNSEDFDGSVFFEKYELAEVPSWVVLTSAGEVKEKWAGGWKDAIGSPSLFIADESKKQVQNVYDNSSVTSMPISKEQTPPATKNVASSTGLTATPTPSKTEKPSSTMTPVTTPVKTEISMSGFVLQAGYFGSETNAQKLVTDLKGKGYGTYSIKTLSQNGTLYFRVISKTYTTETDAIKEQETLSSAGVKATVRKLSEI